MTFKDAAERYIAAHKESWRNPKHAEQWPATLGTYAHPIIGHLSVASIDTGLMSKVLSPIWTKKPETASRVRGRIEAVLDWATAHGFRHGDNPARWRGHLDKLLPKRSKVRKVKHHSALPYAELGAFIGDLRKQEGVSARCLEFTILTCARTGEAIGAKWPEIDLARRLWIVPGERMKGGKHHRVPLSDRAIAILKALPREKDSDWVFIGGKAGAPLSNMAMLETLRRMERGDLTTHGFRSTFRDWAAEQTNFPHELAEMALAHAVSDKVEAAYRRGDMFEKRRKLAAAWATYCGSPKRGGEVVPTREGGASVRSCLPGLDQVLCEELLDPKPLGLIVECGKLFGAIRKSLDEGQVDEAYAVAAAAELALAVYSSGTIPILPSAVGHVTLVDRVLLPDGHVRMTFGLDYENNKAAKLANSGRGRSTGGKNNNDGPEARAQRDAQIVARFEQLRKTYPKMEAYQRTANRCGVGRRTVERVLKKGRAHDAF